MKQAVVVVVGGCGEDCRSLWAGLGVKQQEVHIRSMSCSRDTTMSSSTNRYAPHRANTEHTYAKHKQAHEIQQICILLYPRFAFLQRRHHAWVSLTYDQLWLVCRLPPSSGLIEGSRGLKVREYYGGGCTCVCWGCVYVSSYTVACVCRWPDKRFWCPQ